ncbi:MULTISPECIES: LysR family transcriptional regulator [Pseudomonas]|uniref:HTH lysR-type domain-containing protein n=1 Tax=Pseudomonas putida TaxID=303 RepID=A0A2S3X4K7_PSEPU|nr:MULTISPECIES: LysR family transcriptional regulator [Pseudomonas]PTC01801.1 LysR family transcriptional regulator [Thalassospira xiamenensis]MBF8805136.1 LysR family transcriptional regulator [Pseudomonas asiatica]MCE0881732.1 LysR family transcriptional regulator [Pseudomonas putida]MCE0966988.1 LysR family transcriptional regulator [Pseudomonas sp. NMI4491_12]MDO1496939.1 LysR family transcriptional regulator [Pseudomonas putida]
MPIKLRQIEAFRTVMREGSMVRASAAMAVTQPAISYMISGLETAVGFPLFSRQGGKLSATPEAIQLLAEVDRLYQGLESVEAVAYKIANYGNAELRILITQALSAGRIVNGIGKFAALHPGIKIDLDVEHRALITHRVNSGQADLGILSISSGLEDQSSTLFSSPIICVASPTAQISQASTVTAAQLAGVPLVGLKSNGLIRPMVDQWFHEAGVTPNYTIEVGGAGTAIELVRGGLGVTFVSSFSLMERADSQLQSFELEKSLELKIGVITSSSVHPNRAAHALVQYLTQLYSESVSGECS